MRTETITYKIYQFSELSEEAKQTAVNWFRYGNDYQHVWDDIEASLIGFRDALPNPPENEDLSGYRLRTWIINNFINDIEKGKYYSTGQKWIDGKFYYKSRRSKIQMEICCPFTGVCYDMDILGPILDFVKDPNQCDTWDDLVRECECAAHATYDNQIEAMQEDEYCIESIEANEYEFNEDGTRY